VNQLVTLHIALQLESFSADRALEGLLLVMHWFMVQQIAGSLEALLALVTREVSGL
jgi:hypothetical protein